MADPFVDQYNAFLLDKLSNKAYSFHEDDTHSVFGGKKGKEFFVDGKTGIPTLNITKSGDGFSITLVADISLPYDGKYQEKNFIGIGGEHPNDDFQNPSGQLKFRITKTFLNVAISNMQAVNTTPSADHSATTMSVQAIQNNLIVNVH